MAVEAMRSKSFSEAAQGFDAANLVALQLARGAADRDAVRRSLLEMQVYPGVSGPTTFEPDGNARKRVLRIFDQ